MTFAFSLVKLGIAEAGRLDPSKKGNNLLSATLTYPLPGRPNVTTRVILKPGGSSGFDLEKRTIRKGDVNGRVLIRLARIR